MRNRVSVSNSLKTVCMTPASWMPIRSSLAIGQLEWSRNLARMRIASRLIRVEQGAAIVVRGIRQRTMHQERIELDTAARRDFERHQAGQGERIGVHLAIAQACGVPPLLHAFPVRTGRYLETAVLRIGLIEEQHRRD